MDNIDDFVRVVLNTHAWMNKKVGWMLSEEYTKYLKEGFNEESKPSSGVKSDFIKLKILTYIVGILLGAVMVGLMTTLFSGILWGIVLTVAALLGGIAFVVILAFLEVNIMGWVLKIITEQLKKEKIEGITEYYALASNVSTIVSLFLVLLGLTIVGSPLAAMLAPLVGVLNIYTLYKILTGKYGLEEKQGLLVAVVPTLIKIIAGYVIGITLYLGMQIGVRLLIALLG